MTPTKDPNNELDELRTWQQIKASTDPIDRAAVYINGLSPHNLWKAKEAIETLIAALIDKKVTEASEAQFKLGYEAGVSATNGTLKGISWKEARAQLSKPKEE